jgi:predicted dehydrogenase
MVKIGMVGLGFMAATHLKAYREVEGAEIVALCNPSGNRLDGDFSQVGGNVGDHEPIRLKAGSFKAFTSYKEMLLDPEVDAIDICSPTFVHRELAVLALNAGKHVLCEKPLARFARDARQIMTAAEKSKGILMPAMCLRFWPEWAWLKDAITEARYGKVLSASFRRVAEAPAWGQENFLDGQRSGGALFDLHIHDTDFVQYCFGRPSALQSSGYSTISGAIDHVVTQYHVGSGAMVYAEGAWSFAKGFGFNMSYTVNFENATVDYDLSRGNEPLRICESGKEPVVCKIDGPDGYVGELRHFVESITSGQQPSVVTAQSAIDSIDICEAEELSINNGPSAVGQLVFL